MNKHLISSNKSIKESLSQLDKLAIDSILFVVDDKLKLIGSITDGDVRRGLIKGVNLDDEISKIIK
jgi:CBS domain-containing protein